MTGDLLRALPPDVAEEPSTVTKTPSPSSDRNFLQIGIAWVVSAVLSFHNGASSSIMPSG